MLSTLPTMGSAVTHSWIETPVKMIQRFKGRAYCRTSMYSKPTKIFWWRWFLRPYCFGPRLPWSSWPGDFLLYCSWWLLDVEFWWESPESHGFYPGVVWVGGIVPSLKPQWCPRNSVKQTSKALGSEDKKGQLYRVLHFCGIFNQPVENWPRFGVSQPKPFLMHRKPSPRRCSFPLVLQC